MADKEEAQTEEQQGQDISVEETKPDTTEKENMSDIFRQAVTEIEGKKTDEKIEKKEEITEKDTKEEKTKEKSIETDKTDKEVKKEEETDKKTVEDTEKKEDEIETRGQQLLDEEDEAKKKAEEEKLEAEKQEIERKTKEDREKEADVEPISNDDAKFFIQDLIPKNRIPDKVTIGDVEIDLKDYLEDNPEIPLIASLIGQELLVSYNRNGTILTSNQVQGLLQEQADDLMDEIFGLNIIVGLQNMGHTGIDVETIVVSEEFNVWGEKQNNKVKALFRSDRAGDYAKGIVKFLQDSGKLKTETKTNAQKEKQEKEKKEHVDLHLNTMDSTGSPTGGDEGLSQKQQYDAGFRDIAREVEEKRKKGLM